MIRLLLFCSCNFVVWAGGCYSAGGFAKTTWPHCFQPANKKIQVYSGKTDDGKFMKLGMHVAGHAGGWSSLAMAGNGGMKGARLIIVRKDKNKFIAEDRYSQDYVTPTLFDKQDVRLLFATEENGGTSWGVLLPLNACKPKVNDFETNYPLESDISRWMLWALGTSHDFTYHSSRGQFHANLLTGPKPVPDVTDAEDMRLTMPNVSIVSKGNDKKNPYICALFDVWKLKPKRDFKNKKSHIVAFSPIIQSKYVHHIILYGCDKSAGFDEANAAHGNVIENCESMPPGCREFKWPWAVGGEDIVLPKDVGLPIDAGKRWFMMQTHYYNPSLDSGVRDSSGVDIKLSPTLRKHDADYIQLNGGTSKNQRPKLPAKNKKIEISMSVPKTCTSKWAEPLNVISGAYHQHLAGRTMNVDIIRDGKFIGDLRRENQYDFNHQSLDEGIVRKLMPGDELQVDCTYDTSKRVNETSFGDFSQTEMCYGLIFYYPRQDTNLLSYATYGQKIQQHADSLKAICPEPSAATGFDGMSKCAETLFKDPVNFMYGRKLGFSMTLICNIGIPGFITAERMNAMTFPGFCPPCNKDKNCKDDVMKKHTQDVICPTYCKEFGLSVFPVVTKKVPKLPTEVNFCGGMHYFTPTKYTRPTCSKMGDLTAAAATNLVKLFNGTNYAAPFKGSSSGADIAGGQLTTSPRAMACFFGFMAILMEFVVSGH